MNGSMSGMDYNKIQAILDEVEGCKSKMADILGNLITNIPAAVADAYSAMTTDRPYRKAFDIDKAIEIIQQGAGIKWSQNLVDQFIPLVRHDDTE